MKLACYGIKFKTNILNINVKPNQKINIEIDSARVASSSVVNYNADIRLITCPSCGGVTRVYEGRDAICDYCGGRLNN